MTAAQQQSLGRFVLAGAAGFGLGGVLCGLLQGVCRSHLGGSTVLEALVASAGYGLMGVIGGATLGLAARSPPAVRKLALGGLVGFGVFGLIGLFLAVSTGLDPSSEPPIPGHGVDWNVAVVSFLAFVYLVAFGVRGALGGALLGLVVPGRHSVRVLGFAGFVAFGLGGAAGFGVLNIPGIRPGNPQSLTEVLGVFSLWVGSSTLVGGALFGPAVGRLLHGRTITVYSPGVRRGVCEQ